MFLLFHMKKFVFNFCCSLPIKLLKTTVYVWSHNTTDIYLTLVCVFWSQLSWDTCKEGSLAEYDTVCSINGLIEQQK